MLLTIKLRLKDRHAAELRRQARAVNYVWNYCNETQQKAALSGRRWLNYYDLERLTAGTSKMLGLHAHTIQKVCLQYARSRTQHRKPWLRFRTYKSLGWIPFNQGVSGVTIHAIGRLKFRGRIYETMHWRELPEGAIIRAGSFNQDRRGRWYINMPIEFPETSFAKSATAALGIDFGLKALASLSTGEAVAMPATYRCHEERLVKAQRASKKSLARHIGTKIANQRKDYLHKASARIALGYDLIFVGDVSGSELAQTKMAKSIYDASWYSFKLMLSYKAIRHGGRMIEVDERLTSQTCSSCGALPPERPRGIAGLRIREWTCGGCGATHDRDVNAARNILARGLASLAEGAA